MKILLSAFACSPGVGSEGGCGWRYAARLSLDHEVWVLTDATRRPAVEADSLFQRPSLHVVFYRPWLARWVPLNRHTALAVFELWLAGSWRVARRLDHEHAFDFTWHLTYGSFRHPSRYWRLGKPFVFGPLAGGETSPRRLRRGLPLRYQAQEWLRDAVNQLVLLRPSVRATFRHAALVMARTEDTRAILPLGDRPCPIQQNIGAPETYRVKPRLRAPGEPLRVVFPARFRHFKGFPLAIRAIAAARQLGGTARLTIIGSGPEEGRLRALVAELHLGDRVAFEPELPQEELFRRYRDFDVLLFPSLHDSGGNVVLEALSFGLPVVCLDLGGPPTLVDERCAIVVPARTADTAAVVEGLGAALMRLESDPALRASLTQHAPVRAADLSWDNQIDRCLDLVKQHALPGGR